MAHGDAREGSEGEAGEWSGLPVPITLPRNMVYPALLPLMRTPQLPVIDGTDAPADLNGLLRFTERRNLVSACAITFQTQSNTHSDTIYRTSASLRGTLLLSSVSNTADCWNKVQYWFSFCVFHKSLYNSSRKWLEDYCFVLFFYQGSGIKCCTTGKAAEIFILCISQVFIHFFSEMAGRLLFCFVFLSGKRH